MQLGCKLQLLLLATRQRKPRRSKDVSNVGRFIHAFVHSLSSAVDVVKTACQYKNYCRLAAADVTFGTTCSGAMLLSVSYTCVSGITLQQVLSFD